MQFSIALVKHTFAIGRSRTHQDRADKYCCPGKNRSSTAERGRQEPVRSSPTNSRFRLGRSRYFRLKWGERWQF